MALVWDRGKIKEARPRRETLIALVGASLFLRALQKKPEILSRALVISSPKVSIPSEPVPKGVPPPPASPVISPNKSPPVGYTVRMSEAKKPPLVTPYGEDWTSKIKYTDLNGAGTIRYIDENYPNTYVKRAGTGNIIHCAYCLLRNNYRSFREQAIETLKEP